LISEYTDTAEGRANWEDTFTASFTLRNQKRYRDNFLRFRKEFDCWIELLPIYSKFSKKPNCVAYCFYDFWVEIAICISSGCDFFALARQTKSPYINP